MVIQAKYLDEVSVLGELSLVGLGQADVSCFSLRLCCCDYNIRSAQEQRATPDNDSGHDDEDDDRDEDDDVQDSLDLDYDCVPIETTIATIREQITSHQPLYTSTRAYRRHERLSTRA